MYIRLYCCFLFLMILSFGNLYGLAYDGNFGISTAVTKDMKNDSVLNPDNILDMGYPLSGTVAGDVDIRLLFHEKFTVSVVNTMLFRANYFEEKPDDADELEHSSDLRQLYATFTIGESFFIDAGRKVERAGSAFYRNPSNFFSSSDNSKLSRSKDEQDSNLIGNVLVKAEYFLGSSLSLDAVFSPENEFVDNNITQMQGRISYQFDNSNINLLCYYGDVWKFGTNLSAGIGNSVVLRAEFGISEIRDRYLLNPVMLPPGDSDDGELYEQRKSSMQYPWELITGGHYTFSGGTDLYIEYYYNHLGYTQNEWDELMDTADNCRNVSLKYNRYSMYNLNGAIRDSGGITAARRHYLFLRYSKDNILFRKFNLASVMVIGFENLGGMFTISPQYEISGNSTLKFDLTVFKGTEKSEFEIMYSRAFAGLELEYLF
ncbi:MAG: hypothetical protein PF637_14280 [Spirochaetes bacterium]|jgi:hypothetical protein|nr:hypothetical protein [Spirochaetota bacterium]